MGKLVTGLLTDGSLHEESWALTHNSQMTPTLGRSRLGHPPWSCCVLLGCSLPTLVGVHLVGSHVLLKGTDNSHLEPAGMCQAPAFWDTSHRYHKTNLFQPRGDLPRVSRVSSRDKQNSGLVIVGQSCPPPPQLFMETLRIRQEHGATLRGFTYTIQPHSHIPLESQACFLVGMRNEVTCPMSHS